MPASSDFKERQHVVNLWDDVVRMTHYRNRYSDTAITAKIVEASNKARWVDIAGLPSITSNDLSYQAVKDWLATGVPMSADDRLMIEGGQLWLERWIKDSQNR